MDADHDSRTAAGTADPPETAGAMVALTLLSGVVDGLRTGSTDRFGQEEVLEALAALRELREQVAGWEPELIAAARDAGVSWVRLAPALGVTSRQAAERRYLRLQPLAGTRTSGEPDGGTATGESRVQATRDQRAGDRAVHRWATDNAAGLRRLAGQVTALAGLDAATQRRADELQAALAQDDAIALLTPLKRMHAHLVTDHPGLAAQITTAATDAEHWRQATIRDRQNP